RRLGGDRLRRDGGRRGSRDADGHRGCDGDRCGGGERQHEPSSIAESFPPRGGDGLRRRGEREHLESQRVACPRARAAQLVDDLVHGHSSLTLSSSRLSARESRVETAVGLIPSTRAAASPSSSSTIRSASTSRSPALSDVSAVSSSGERPSTKASSTRSSSAAAASRFRLRASPLTQSRAVVLAMPSSHVLALPRRGSKRSHILSAFSNVELE